MFIGRYSMNCLLDYAEGSGDLPCNNPLSQLIGPSQV